MPAPEEMSRDELIALVGRQDGQITVMAVQIADLVEARGPGGEAGPAGVCAVAEQ